MCDRADDAFELTVVVPTRDRPHSLAAAVKSALGQSGRNVEVVVVDDGSTDPAEPPSHPRLRCLRLNRPSGVAAARNAGLAAARGRWITFLDDDDILLPGMADICLSAITSAEAPPPVAVISGVEVVGRHGRVLERRRPPTHERGRHFSLEPLPPGCSHVTKNTLVVERRLMARLGGFDPSLAACEWIDLFLRLNPVCSIIGLPEATYRLTREPAPRFSRNRKARETGFIQLVAKHADLFAAHPEGHAGALLGEARMSLSSGSIAGSVRNLGRAFRIAPGHTLKTVLSPTRLLRSARNLRSSG